jgi:hypothetical protein
MFLQNEEENVKEYGNVKELLYQGFEYISKIIIEEIGKTDRSNDAKLGMIDKNIFVIYKEIGKLLD